MLELWFSSLRVLHSLVASQAGWVAKGIGLAPEVSGMQIFRSLVKYHRLLDSDGGGAHTARLVLGCATQGLAQHQGRGVPKPRALREARQDCIAQDSGFFLFCPRRRGEGS